MSFQSYAILIAHDLGRAKKFYQDSLGLKVEEMEGIIMVEAGGNSRIVVYEKPRAPIPTHSVLGFDVKDLPELLEKLKSAGVKQDMNDLPEGTDDQGIMSYGPVRTAWINDSEGNIIALNEWIA